MDQHFFRLRIQFGLAFAFRPEWGSHSLAQGRAENLMGPPIFILRVFSMDQHFFRLRIQFGLAFAFRPEWGSHSLAQGRAQRRPGSNVRQRDSALKGQNCGNAIWPVA